MKTLARIILLIFIMCAAAVCSGADDGSERYNRIARAWNAIAVSINEEEQLIREMEESFRHEPPRLVQSQRRIGLAERWEEKTRQRLALIAALRQAEKEK